MCGLQFRTRKRLNNLPIVCSVSISALKLTEIVFRPGIPGRFFYFLYPKIMLKVCAAIFSLLICVSVNSQNDTNSLSKKIDSCQCQENFVNTFAEEMPAFVGGESAFQSYLKKNIVYPDTAIKLKQQGTIYITFTVDRTGAVCNVRLAKGLPRASSLNEEALRVIRASPVWVPGKMNGRPICVEQTVPIRFLLH